MGIMDLDHSPPKRKCVLCKERFFYDDMVDICRAKQGIQKFNICKECLDDLNMMLSRLNSGVL